MLSIGSRATNILMKNIPSGSYTGFDLRLTVHEAKLTLLGYKLLLHQRIEDITITLQFHHQHFYSPLAPLPPKLLFQPNVPRLV